MEKEIDINIDLSKNNRINPDTLNIKEVYEDYTYQKIQFKNMNPIARDWLNSLDALDIKQSRLTRGQRYFEEGRILNLDMGYNIISSTIRGENSTYDVTINFNEIASSDKNLLYKKIEEEDFIDKGLDNDLMRYLLPNKDNVKCSCTCPDNVENEEICKHIVTTLIGAGHILNISPLSIIKLHNLDNQSVSYKTPLKKRKSANDREIEIDIKDTINHYESKPEDRIEKELDIDIDLNRQRQEVITNLNKVPLPKYDDYTRTLALCFKQNNFNINDTIKFLRAATHNDISEVEEAFEYYIKSITIKDLIDKTLINRVDIIAEKYKEELIKAIKNGDVNSSKHVVGIINKKPKFSEKIKFVIELIDRRLVIIVADRKTPIFKYYTDLLDI